MNMNLVERLKKDKKGFTLVEMIVVIVIIGILLAILVPGMFKYIQKAKDRQILVDARTAYLDIQMASQELYAGNGVTGDKVASAIKNIASYEGEKKVDIKDGDDVVKSVTINIPTGGKVTDITIDETNGQVTGMTYTAGERKIVMEKEVWGEVEPVGSGD